MFDYFMYNNNNKFPSRFIHFLIGDPEKTTSANEILLTNLHSAVLFYYKTVNLLINIWNLSF